MIFYFSNQTLLLNFDINIISIITQGCINRFTSHIDDVRSGTQNDSLIFSGHVDPTKSSSKLRQCATVGVCGRFKAFPTVGRVSHAEATEKILTK